MTREQFMDKLNELAVTYDAHGEPSDSPPTIDEAITWAAFTEARTVTLALLRHATVGPGFWEAWYKAILEDIEKGSHQINAGPPRGNAIREYVRSVRWIASRLS